MAPAGPLSGMIKFFKITEAPVNVWPLLFPGYQLLQYHRLFSSGWCSASLWSYRVPLLQVKFGQEVSTPVGAGEPLFYLCQADTILNLTGYVFQ